MSNSKAFNPKKLPTLLISALLVLFTAVSSTALAYVYISDFRAKAVLGKKDKRPSNPKASSGKRDEDDKIMQGNVSNEVRVNPAEKPVGNSQGNSKNLSVPRGKGSSQSREYIKNSTAALTGLSDLADDLEQEYNTEASEELEEVVEESQEDNDVMETANALDELENRPQWKTLLIGTDYKNLGQLRAAMVKNRNMIRKLNRVKTKVQGEETSVALEQQIQTLEQEQERIGGVIEEKESQFSLLGWAFKYLYGFTPVDTEETEDSDEVEETTEDTTPSTTLEEPEYEAAF